MPPSTEAHLRAARKNKALANTLLDTDHEWAVVVAFYSALHFIQAYFVAQNLKPNTHAARENYIGRLRELQPVHGTYRKLQTRSEWVRYTLDPVSRAEATYIATKDLQEIEDHVLQLLTLKP